MSKKIKMNQTRQFYRYCLYYLSGKQYDFYPTPDIVSGADFTAALREHDLKNVYQIDLIIDNVIYDTTAALNSLTPHDVNLCARGGMPMARTTCRTKTMTVLMADAVMSPGELEQIYHEKYLTIFHMERPNSDHAIVVRDVKVQRRSPKSPAKGYPIYDTGHMIKVHALNPNVDIVINRDLNQIYPYNTVGWPTRVARFLSGKEY